MCIEDDYFSVFNPPPPPLIKKNIALIRMKRKSVDCKKKLCLLLVSVENTEPEIIGCKWEKIDHINVL